MGLLTVVSRLGAASAPWVAQYLADVHEILPFTVMGGLAVIAAVVMFKLRETNGVPTAEILESGKKLQIFFYTAQWAKSPKNCLKECVFC